MADQRISDLDPAATLDGAELIELVQAGVNVRSTVAALTARATGARVKAAISSAAAITLQTGGINMATFGATIYTLTWEVGFFTSNDLIVGITPAAGSGIRAIPSIIAVNTTSLTLSMRVIDASGNTTGNQAGFHVEVEQVEAA